MPVCVCVCVCVRLSRKPKRCIYLPTSSKSLPSNDVDFVSFNTLKQERYSCKSTSLLFTAAVDSIMRQFIVLWCHYDVDSANYIIVIPR